MLSTKHLLTNLKPESLVALTFRASICHKSQLPDKVKQGKVYHWPYEKKPWNYRTLWLDPFTKKKMTENSKLICIEGNIHAGKEDFAKRLAEQLGAYYMPPIDLEGYYINEHGFDYRALNALLPERLRYCDWEMFHESPNRQGVVLMELYILKLKAMQLIKACAHVLNTGQGVVMVRSAFSERTFVDAMHEVGWLPRGYLRKDGFQFFDFRSHYDSVRNNLLADFPSPHLNIYLDTPVDVCLDRLKNSSDPMIANSKAHTKEFLEAIEKVYQTVLQKLDYNGHVLTYDYSERATDDEILDVIDDMSKLNFDYDAKDTRFMAWNYNNTFLNDFFMRKYFTSYGGIYKLLGGWERANIHFDIAGMGDTITQRDLTFREMLLEAHVGPVGLSLNKFSDFRFNPNKLKAWLGLKPFENRVRDLIYTDCL